MRRRAGRRKGGRRGGGRRLHARVEREDGLQKVRAVEFIDGARRDGLHAGARLLIIRKVTRGIDAKLKPLLQRGGEAPWRTLRADVSESWERSGAGGRANGGKEGEDDQ